MFYAPTSSAQSTPTKQNAIAESRGEVTPKKPIGDSTALATPTGGNKLLTSTPTQGIQYAVRPETPPRNDDDEISTTASMGMSRVGVYSVINLLYTETIYSNVLLFHRLIIFGRE